MEFLRVNEDHRSASSSRQRIDHPHPEGLTTRLVPVEVDLKQQIFDVRSSLAGSTGRRNTGVKSLCWGFKLQGLTWSLVELTSHFVQIGLRVHRQVGALRKVLSEQTIGVLI